MKYHQRLIESKLQAYVESFACTLLTGARQVGKSTLLDKRFGKDYQTFVFDPAQDIYGVKRDPDRFLRNNPPPLILDEIQTGMGRTGTLFAYEQYGIEPDIMTLAKGLASGVPIGAILATEKASVFTPGEHGSTFGGNPLACAAGYATLKFIIDNDIPANAGATGQYLMGRLVGLKGEFPFISEVRGRGLLVALEFNSDIAGAVVMACLERGLLVNRLKPNALRFMPPLIIGRDEVDKAVGILEEALAGITSQA